MGLNEFPPQPREGLMTKLPPCAPWPAASFNQGIWHLPKLLGYEERGAERRSPKKSRKFLKWQNIWENKNKNKKNTDINSQREKCMVSFKCSDVERLCGC